MAGNQVRATLRLTTVWLVLLVVMVTSLSLEAEARRRRRSRRSKNTQVEAPEKKLFERMGGKAGIDNLVEDLGKLVLADQRLAPAFAPLTEPAKKWKSYKGHLQNWFCEMGDGPCKPALSDLAGFFKEAQLNDERYYAFVDDLYETMTKMKIGEREKNQFLSQLGGAKSIFFGRVEKEEIEP